VQYLTNHQYAFTGQLIAILQNYIPLPDTLVTQLGLTPQQFYANITYYLGYYRTQYPDQFADYTIDYQPAQMATEINMRVVQPTLQAGALFDKFAYLTRLYTTISPEDMNKDPVFSFNPGLPDWSNVHDGTLTYHCGIFGGSGNQANTPATLRTSSGWVLSYPNGVGSAVPLEGLPGSERIEVLREEGGPEVVTNNDSLIDHSLDSSGGCGFIVGGRAGGVGGAAGFLLVAGLALLWRRRRWA
jgi:hypothetical protein